MNWAKDQGFLIPVPLATPIHQQRSVRLATWDGTGWLELRQKPSDAFPENIRQNAEHPQIAFAARHADSVESRGAVLGVHPCFPSPSQLRTFPGTYQIFRGAGQQSTINLPLLPPGFFLPTGGKGAEPAGL